MRGGRVSVVIYRHAGHFTETSALSYRDYRSSRQLAALNNSLEEVHLQHTQ